jgi:hypothetical protein
LSRPPLELRPADAVIEEDAVLGDGPALLGGVGFGVLDLPRDRLLLVVDAVLFGGFPRVDGSDHSVLLLSLSRCSTLIPKPVASCVSTVNEGFPWCDDLCWPGRFVGSSFAM